MRKFLPRVLAGAALALALAGFIAAPAHADTPVVTVSSPCYEPAFGRDRVYWTVTNHTAADIVAIIYSPGSGLDPTDFTVPAAGSIVWDSFGAFEVQVTVGSVVVSGSVSRDALTECGTTQDSFNLIVDCRPSPYQVSLRIKNATDQARQYKLVKQRGEELTGTALPGNTYITEDWVKPTDRWVLEIAGYRYVRLVNEPALCNAPSPTPTVSSSPSSAPTSSTAPTSTVAPSPAPTQTADPTSPAPTLAPASSVSGLDSGSGVLAGGLAGLLVGTAMGLAFRFRRGTSRG